MNPAEHLQGRFDNPQDYEVEPEEEELEDPFGFVPEEDETSYSQNEDSEGYPEFGSKSKEIEFSRSSVSGLNECLSEGARRLCLFDLALKLNKCDHYDIGGTYLRYNTEIRPELWFYCTTSLCPQGNYLLNIFFCFRKGAFATIGISDSSTIKKKNISFGDAVTTYLTLSETLHWKSFKSCEKEESHHLKSFCFSKQDLKVLHKQILSIPIKIDINTNNMSYIDAETMLRIKRDYNLSSLFKRNENTDFLLESTSGTKYEVHTLLLAAVSSVLRDEMKDASCDLLNLQIDDDAMEQFLEYMYTGTVKNIKEHNWCQLIELSNQFKLDKLFKKVENTIIQQITIDNAVNIAVISEKYKLETVQNKVFQYIRSEPQVLNSEGWKNLNDVELTKKLFKELYREESTE